MQDSISSRRGFLGWTNRLLAVAGLAARPLPAELHFTLEGADYYEKLGVAKIINAAGTYTALTASTMPPSVTGAVARAAAAVLLRRREIPHPASARTVTSTSMPR